MLELVDGVLHRGLQVHVLLLDLFVLVLQGCDLVLVLLLVLIHHLLVLLLELLPLKGELTLQLLLLQLIVILKLGDGLFRLGMRLPLFVTCLIHGLLQLPLELLDLVLIEDLLFFEPAGLIPLQLRVLVGKAFDLFISSLLRELTLLLLFHDSILQQGYPEFEIALSLGDSLQLELQLLAGVLEFCLDVLHFSQMGVLQLDYSLV